MADEHKLTKGRYRPGRFPVGTGGAHKCPVCEKTIFEEYNSFEICRVCRWEDDGVQESDPDYKGGANWLSLNRARENYRTLGTIMTERDREEKEKFFRAHVALDGSWIHDEDDKD